MFLQHFTYSVKFCLLLSCLFHCPSNSYHKPRCRAWEERNRKSYKCEPCDHRRLTGTPVCYFHCKCQLFYSENTAKKRISVTKDYWECIVISPSISTLLYLSGTSISEYCLVLFFSLKTGT